MTLPDTSAFELDARTTSGDIDSSHPITVTGRIAKNTLRGSVRGGGHRLAVRTSVRLDRDQVDETFLLHTSYSEV